MNRWSQLPGEWRVAAAAPGSVLLETAHFDSANSRSLLFLHPARVLSVSTLDQIPTLFEELEEALAAGFHVAGFVGYECGYHFQSLETIAPDHFDLPLAWFGVYRDPLIFDHRSGRFEGDSSLLPALSRVGALAAITGLPLLTLPEEVYCEKIGRIKSYIEAGDTYQVNFTDSVGLEIASSAEEAFAALLRRQPVAYSASLHAGDQHILSFSPELFFRIADGRIITRPMKGTMPRGLDTAEDVEAMARLKNDEKNRAEHVMIVDLLRNDIGRICAMGSVGVEAMFSVEKYRTLFQMTSTVSGTLLPELTYYDIFRSMFPCGSVTGAPKIRTMEIIRELEPRPRGVYAGAIGFISPDRSATFNVAIRTLVLKDGHARMGVGSGIVADSEPREEFRECLLKADFLIRSPGDFQLIETMLWDGEFRLLAMHLDRMEASAAYFDFLFDREAVTSQLIKLSQGFARVQHHRVRLLLDSAGRTTVTEARLLPETSRGCVSFAKERTFSGDVFLRHKTTLREVYDRLYREAREDGLDDVLFLNERDEVTEGAISTLFILREGKLLTPPLRSGVLPGVYRRHLLESDPAVQECVLTLEDLRLSESVFLANSIRGLRQVKHLCFDPCVCGLRLVYRE